VTSAVQAVKVGSAVEVGTGAVLTKPDESPPDDPDEDAQRSWAVQWAVSRKAAKTARNFAEADRIRGLLKAAGWEVRDNRDGSIEVVRSRV